MLRIQLLHNDTKQGEEKVRLMDETGLDTKQLNNWFINQRKRNWDTSLAFEWKETGTKVKHILLAFGDGQNVPRISVYSLVAFQWLGLIKQT